MKPHHVINSTFCCVWWLFLLALVVQRAAAFGELQGFTLSGCVLLESPYVVSDASRRKGYSGVAMTYLERMQDNLQFRLNLTLWDDSWSKLIETMSTCEPQGAGENECPCEVGIGSFTMTNERAEMIKFVWPLSNEAHQMVSRKADLRVDDGENTWFVFRTFSVGVWMIIAVGIIMHAIGTVFFGPFRPPETAHVRSVGGVHTFFGKLVWRLQRFPAAILFSYAHLIGHPFEDPTQGKPSFHRMAWLVLGVTTGIFLLTVYQASLTVLLFESTRESPFHTLNDLKDCAVPPARVAMIEGGASQDFWNSAVNTTENRRKCPEWGQVGMTVANLEAGFTALRNHEADYFYSLEGSVLFRAHRNCEEFEAVGEPFFSTSVALVMPNKTNVELHRLLSRETRVLREQDGYPSARILAARNECEPALDATITSGKLWMFFVLYAIMWGLLLVYRCVFLWRRKKLPGELGSIVESGGGVPSTHAYPMPVRGAPVADDAETAESRHPDHIPGVTDPESTDSKEQFDSIVSYEWEGRGRWVADTDKVPR